MTRLDDAPGQVWRRIPILIEEFAQRTGVRIDEFAEREFGEFIASDFHNELSEHTSQPASAASNKCMCGFDCSGRLGGTPVLKPAPARFMCLSTRVCRSSDWRSRSARESPVAAATLNASNAKAWSYSNARSSSDEPSAATSVRNRPSGR